MNFCLNLSLLSNLRDIFRNMKRVGVPNVLVIDEINQKTNDLVVKLRGIGYVVDVVEESSLGIQLAQQSDYQIIILDEELPEVSGSDVCRRLRQKGVTTPILMVSESTQKISLIRCLELGADDFLVQPLNHNELIARIRALVRRDNKSFASFWADKCGISLDMATHTVFAQDMSSKLTRKEALLLKRLMIEASSTISRESLLQDVWGIDDLHTSNRLDVYVRRLRWKLEQLTNQNLIHTVRGQGYYFSHQPDDTDSKN